MAEKYGTPYRMNVTTMRALEASLGHAADGIANDLRGLEATIRRMLSEWDGGAAEAFATAQREWTETVAQMNYVLRRAGSTVGILVDDHEAARRRAAARWAS